MEIRKCHANADADDNADANRIRTKKQYAPSPSVGDIITSTLRKASETSLRHLVLSQRKGSRRKGSLFGVMELLQLYMGARWPTQCGWELVVQETRNVRLSSKWRKRVKSWRGRYVLLSFNSVGIYWCLSWIQANMIQSYSIGWWVVIYSYGNSSIQRKFSCWCGGNCGRLFIPFQGHSYT